MRTGARVQGEDRWKAALKAKAHAADRANYEATRRAARAGVRAVKEALSIYRHPPGTPTPAPRGGPPAMVSGALHDHISMDVVRRGGAGVWETRFGPTGLPYERIQELGGWAGAGHRSYIPSRPYQKPRTRAELARIRRIYRDAWTEALRA